jgi:hypothetical protein
MVTGVVVKPLKLIPDDRGFLMELLRSDEPVFEAFGQVYITGCRGGTARPRGGKCRSCSWMRPPAGGRIRSW